MIKKLYVFILIFFTFSFSIYLQNVKVIKNPKPTHFENEFVQLKMLKKVSYDFDDEHFIGKVRSVTADKKGNLYIYDSFQTKIFKLNKDLKFIKAFGSEGKGPGEFGSRTSPIELNIGPDNKLYVSDPINHKIHLFDLNGKFIKDYPIKYTHGFPPLLSTSGDFIIPSSDNENILSIYSKKMKLKKTLLKRSELKRFLFFKPGHIIIRYLTYPMYKINLFYRLFPDNRMIIILSNDMTYFFFKDYKFVKKIKILPAAAIKVYKRDYLESIRNEEDAFHPLVHQCFIDLDDFNSFYLRFSKNRLNNRVVLYKFSLGGNLIKVLYIKTSKTNESPSFLFKKYNIFYVKDSENLYLYKEGISEKRN